MLYDAATDTAAAFIGLNNPHAQEAPEELCPNRFVITYILFLFLKFFCHPIIRCASMDWVDWELTELDAGKKWGYSYDPKVCSV